MRGTSAIVATTVVIAAGAGCTQPGADRAAAELAVGQAAAAGWTVAIDDGLGAVRRLDPAVLEVWAGAPTIELTLGAAVTTSLTVIIHNAVPDAEITSPTVALGATTTGARVTDRTVSAVIPAGAHRLRVAAPDADEVGRFRVVAMADIQTALPTVDEVFARIAGVPDVRFVVSMGDLTERALEEEYDLFEAQLAYLPVPYYTTLGNHELWTEADNYFRRFGRASFQARFKGAAFTFADSGDGGLDPTVEGWLDGWLADGADDLHLFLTHYPPIDPVGVRAGSFRSRRQAHQLLARLSEGGVDLTLYGHVHTFLAYENAGIPAYISGGGGAVPVRWDGIGRHVLVVDLDPARGAIDQVGVARVD
ncbi:MAG: metallophosphoesterase [Kofleriaceae bacterium]|nr:metallophosphoesterase [Kofleriaceae bacterium]